MSTIATVDLSRWRAGGSDADAVAAETDEGLQRAGFILVTGHGVDPDLAAATGGSGPEPRPTPTPRVPRHRPT